ncbi:MAG: hypothetical protein RIF44_14020 [Nitratireductor sp.]
MRGVSRDEALKITAESLGVTGSDDLHAITKGALRRALFALAPTSQADVVRSVFEPLAPLGADREWVEEALEDLVVYGDALEMRKIRDDPWDAPGIVLRPAPPSFVERDDGTLMILGVAGELPTALPAELDNRVTSHGPVRTLSAQKSENLASYLKLLGFVQLSEQAWLCLPTAETASTHCQRWEDALHDVDVSQTDVEGIEILDPAKPVSYYRGRWRTPTRDTNGTFVARRPQLYGARLWSLLELRDGLCYRVLDLYGDENRQRPCDVAWRLQAAKDAVAGKPQEIRICESSDGCTLDFFGPIPAFAERRLLLVGTKRKAENCLFSFSLEAAQLKDEIAALERYLWMRPVHQGECG